MRTLVVAVLLCVLVFGGLVVLTNAKAAELRAAHQPTPTPRVARVRVVIRNDMKRNSAPPNSVTAAQNGGAVISYQTGSPPAHPVIDAMRYYGAAYGIDWRLLYAQMWKESNFDYHARGAAGEKGACQFMPGTWAAFGQGDPDDPVACVAAQARYLAYVRGRNARAGVHDVWSMIAGYNCGPGCSASGSWPAVTIGYVRDVQQRYAAVCRIWSP